MAEALPSCRKPPNGHGCIRDDDIDAIYHHLKVHDSRHEEHDSQFGRMLQVATDNGVKTDATHTVVASVQAMVRELADGMTGFVTRVDQRFDVLERQVAEQSVARAVQLSRDWELDEPTLAGRAPDEAAQLWKARAGESEEKREALAVAVSNLQAQLRESEKQREELSNDVAALKAKDEERTRHSDRVRQEKKEAAQLRIQTWQLALGFIATVVTSGVGAAIVTRLLGG